MRVARRCGQMPHQVWNASYAVTLHTDYVMRDQDRMDDFERRFREIDAAYITNHAVNDPKLLQQDRAFVRDDVMRSPLYVKPAPETVQSERDAMIELASDIRRRAREG